MVLIRLKNLLEVVDFKRTAFPASKDKEMRREIRFLGMARCVRKNGKIEIDSSNVDAARCVSVVRKMEKMSCQHRKIRVNF
jgi:hypothetical protein